MIKNLSLHEIKQLRELILENAMELLEEAELLFSNGKFARTYALAHLSSEELAKLPLLAAVAVNLVNAATIDWKKLDKKLRSHSDKMKGLLVVDLLGKGINPSVRDIQVHEKRLSRVELFNELKNVSLYAGVYQESLYKPNSSITEELASQGLTAAKNRLELFFAIESSTNGRAAELAGRGTYIKLLNTLGVSDDAN